MDNRTSGVKFGDLPTTYLRCRMCGVRADVPCIISMAHSDNYENHFWSGYRGSHRERRIDVGKLESEASGRQAKNRKSRVSPSKARQPELEVHVYETHEDATYEIW